MKSLSEHSTKPEPKQEKNTNALKPYMDIHERLQHIGREFVDICHYIILFLISVVVVWTAGKEFFIIFQKGSADLKDILSKSAVKPRPSRAWM